ncbi:MAG: HlyD family type I secretion periplasmic adaptor subunit [Pseudomonadota bacterium]
MKIKGSSKIVKLEETNESSASVNPKRMQEELIFKAEASDLLHPEGIIEGNQTKLQKAKKLAKDVIEKTKPFREKQLLLASEAIKKARGISPYVDKTITGIDIAINYITKTEDPSRREVVQETRSPAIFGVWVLIITFGVGMLWATFAPLDSASHAMGKIILESKKRIIQHPYGGLIKEVLVRDGDHVVKGQELLLLDDTELKARKKQIEYKYLSTLAELAKLTSERDNLASIKFPEEILSYSGDPKIQEMMHNQEKTFAAKQATITSQIALTEKNVAQSIEQRNALEPQIEATEKLIKITGDQVASYKKLFAKGNISKVYLQEAETRNADAIGRRGQLISTLAAAEQATLRAQFELENIKQKFFHDTVERLKQAQAELSIVSEQLKETEQHLKLTVVTAPEEGNISNVNEHLTPHSVIHPQHTLMEIVPQDDKLIIEAKVPASEIATVKVGQISRVRLTAFRARIVPVLEGTVVSIGADVTMPDQMDLQTGAARQPYYKVRIEIDKDYFDQVAKAKNVFLYPGMGADVLIVTGTRTLMQYLMDPITLTLDKAFREK